ncbi:hypothetical protein GOP47_0022725 [Adiantum capillus-veneris]|uniref:SUMO-activating enzyme subunit n=1 Tax=Adiantum capillus-veneris TaxID=13818 RepID=A0A9D4Z746_ADICA|nr:hypothetical protein GOP47_0022725 [Adiantum capillus-veneris]
MASAEELAVIEKAKVLMVGAGGIGCELLKTLALTGFKDIHLIDLDTIEVSNLNRQFLFRKQHVGQSKAKVAREAVLKFKPDLKIEAYHANVKNSDFNVDYFRQFNVVLNGLDNVDARRHVNRLCLAAGVPLVESGSTGYLGQVTVHVKDRTECYECQTKELPKTYPVCTITSTPSKPVHCIVWAKDLLFGKLFGDKNQSSDLVVHTTDQNTSAATEDAEFFNLKDGETFESYACRVFDGVFGHNIEVALKNEDTWRARKRPRPLHINEVCSDSKRMRIDTLTSTANGSSEHTVSAARMLGLNNHQEVWSLKENASVFLQALELFHATRKKEFGSLVFDKDDQLAVEFVTAAANLRASCFDIPMQSLFEAKGIAGNIVHAIATTNAIISGLIVLEAIKLLMDSLDDCRTTYCLEYPRRRMLLMPAELSGPKSSCYVCSQTPLCLEVNTSNTKLKDIVEKIVKGKLSVNSPIIMQGSYLIYETGEDLEEDMVARYNQNLEKCLDSFPTPIVDGSILLLEDLQQEFTCSLQIKHRETFDEEKEPDNMVLSGKFSTAARDQTSLGLVQPAVDNNPIQAIEDDDEVILVGDAAKSGIKRKSLEEDAVVSGKRQRTEAS